MVEGHLNHAPDEISDLYFSMKRRGFGWWQRSSFSQGHYWSHSNTVPNTPVEVLQDMYDSTAKESAQYGTDRTLTSIITHPNSTLKMAIQASTSENESIKQAGFARLIEIEKEKEK